MRYLTFSERRALGRNWRNFAVISQMLCFCGFCALVLAVGYIAAYVGFVAGGAQPLPRDVAALVVSCYIGIGAVVSMVLFLPLYMWAALRASRYPSR